MSGNLFGNIFRVLTFGESHGPYIGLVIDGLMPGIPLDISAIQAELDRRKPGQSPVTSSRREPDRVQIISGIFEGKTTGTPLCLLIPNRDARPADYRELENILRPGHAGYTFLQKYGIYDYRGGGRASGRETASRVAAGAVAKQLLRQRGIRIIGYTRQVGKVVAKSTDLNVIEKNALRAPDLKAAQKMEATIRQAQQEGDSLGGIVEIVVQNCPAGLGEPVFHKLETDLAAALMSIGAVKAFEIGSGFRAAEMKGSQHNDPFYFDEEQKRVRTRTNNAGGVLGGISNGEDLVMRIAVKPPSSIGKAQQTVDRQGNPVQLKTGGRHDPCICPRIVPVAEAMVALVLIDHILMQERLTDTDDLIELQQKIDTLNTQILLLLSQRKKILRKIKSLPVGREEIRAMEEAMKAQWEEMSAILGIRNSDLPESASFLSASE